MSRKSPHIKWENPFTLYMEMVKATMQMAELYSASAQVIAHRSNMMVSALKGDIPLNHKEFNTMWKEKMVAGSESLTAGIKFMSKTPSESVVNGFMKTMTPYQKKASANAKRLNKKNKTGF